MRLLKAFRLACFGLWANRVRVFFSMIGVMIGVFAIVVLVSIGTGVERTIIKQMGGLGSEQLMVVPGRVMKTEQGQHDFLNGMTNISSTLTYEDAKEIMKQPSVKNATPHLETVIGASYENQSVEGILTGVTAGYKQVMHLKMESGRFFTDEDEQEKRRVVVLGSDVHRSLIGREQDTPAAMTKDTPPEALPTSIWKKIQNWLFGSEVRAAEHMPTLVGKDINIKGQTFRVIGVLQSQATLGSTVNNTLIFPVSTALDVTNMKNLTKIYVQAKNQDVIDQAETETFEAIRNRHSETDFSIVKQTEMLKAMSKITTILQVMVIGIASMAFIISGIGIMNVMTMSVRERTREIGVRKALGAKTTDILYQFFLETLLLTAVGGLIGLLLGYGTIELWNQNMDVFPLILPVWAIKLALASSLITGCVFGVYPALKAARLQPSRALRYGD